MSTPSVYSSTVKVSIEPLGVKAVSIPILDGVARTGFHRPIAVHYEIPEGTSEELPATLDYLVAAFIACLAGTLSRALANAKIPVMKVSRCALTRTQVTK